MLVRKETGMELHVRVHHEDGAYWAEVVELPGCFASGDTLDELAAALKEAVALYRDEGLVGDARALEVDGLVLA